MNQQAFICLRADRIENGPVRFVAGAVQQETRLYLAGVPVCTVLVTFAEGSAEFEAAMAAREVSPCLA